MTQKGTLVFALIIVVLLSVSLVSAITGKIGNARAVLYPKLGLFGASIERTILVINDNDVPVKVTLKTNDENSSKMINLIDKEFVLEPGEEKNAAFKIKVKEEGSYELRIGVMFSPIEEKGSGVALTSTMIIYASKSSGVDYGDIEEEDDTSNSDNLDNTIDSGNKEINTGMMVAFVSSVILAGILVYLMVMLSRKAKKNKRSDRSS